MAIEDRNLTANTRLVARYKGAEYHALVVKTKEGLRFNVTKKGSTKATAHKSLSAAGSAIMGGQACNGWRFWSREADAKAAAKANAKAKAAKANGTEPAAKPMIDKLEDGRAFCTACQKAFDFDGAKLPTDCPEGHKAAEKAAKA